MLDTLQPAAEDIRLPDWIRNSADSYIQDMLALAARPGVLSFALGLPDPEMFPTAEYARAVEYVLSNDGRALQYGVPFQPLRAQAAALMVERGVECSEDQVFLTTGAQQGMCLLARLLLQHGGQVICEELIYSGFRQVIDPYEPHILTVPTDLDTGMDVEAVERLLAGGKRVAFIYAITDGHNPLGISMSRRKRERLVELAREYRVPIIEDDPYGFLHYDADPLPPLRALDDRWVFYVGTFSKILAPSLRVGWIIAPKQLLTKLSVVKESIDIDTSTLTQRTISRFLETADMTGRLEGLRRGYKVRRDAMVKAAETHFPAEARWGKPRNGFFIWVEMPEGVNTLELLKPAVEAEGVAFVPGQPFSVAPGAHPSRCLRLSFSTCAPPLIEEGISRLGRVLQAAIAQAQDRRAMAR